MEAFIEIREDMSAMDVASLAHNGQYRRDGVTPYIRHIESVVGRVEKKYKDKIMSDIAALHDVLEDSDTTEQDLLKYGFSDQVIEGVKLLTKKKGENYFDYLEKIKGNDLARRVKIEDMLSNLSDDPSDRQIEKYCNGLLFLVK